MNPRKILMVLAATTVLAAGSAMAGPDRMPAWGPAWGAGDDGIHHLHADRNGVSDGELLGMIRFAPGSTELNAESRRMLDKVGDLLPAGSRTLVVIGGIPGRPGEEPLSVRRAEAVQDYLADRGVTETRIDAGLHSDTATLVPEDHSQVRISVTSG